MKSIFWKLLKLGLKNGVKTLMWLGGVMENRWKVFSFTALWGLAATSFSCSSQNKYDHYLFMDMIYVKHDSFIYDEAVVNNSYSKGSGDLFYAAFSKPSPMGKSFYIEFTRNSPCREPSCKYFVESEFLQIYKNEEEIGDLKYVVDVGERGTMLSSITTVDSGSFCTENYFGEVSGIFIRIRRTKDCSNLEQKLVNMFEFKDEGVDDKGFSPFVTFDNNTNPEYIRDILHAKGYKDVRLNAHK